MVDKNIDKNIEHYTYEELTTILGLTYPATDADIKEKSNAYIEKYKKKDKGMVKFFQDIQSALLEENDDIEVKKEEESSNVYNVPVKKDVLNPLLKNIFTRVVNIDSQYRDNTFESQGEVATEFSSTYFNANLCDHLYNVLSITIDNVVIPKSWYAIDDSYNNNFFWITNYDKDYLIVVNSGNYTGEEFVNAMNAALTLAGFTSSNGFCSYNTFTNKFSFALEGCLDPSGMPINIYNGDFTEEETLKALEVYAYFTFYDIGNIKMYKHIDEYGNDQTNICSLSSMNVDSTLGWLMGFRLPYLFVKSGNEGTVPINLNGATYFLLTLLDYQTNRVNNDIVTIGNRANSQIMIPNYINASLLYKCIRLKNNLDVDNIEQMLFNQSPLSNTRINQYIPSAPRILTQTQLYTTNEILKNNFRKTMDYRTSGPTTNDVLALIPINTQGLKNGALFIQDKIRTNKRVFFGPVNIDRFTVRLVNDRGQLVNLNGSDWSFTLNVEILYQI